MVRRRAGPDSQVKYFARKVILSQLRQLKPLERQCAELYFEHGASKAQIAKTLGIGLAETDEHLKRAHSELLKTHGGRPTDLTPQTYEIQSLLSNG